MIQQYNLNRYLCMEILCLKYTIFYYQEKIWLKRMLSTDKFLVPPTEDQKVNCAVFEAPMSELKGNY